MTAPTIPTAVTQALSASGQPLARYAAWRRVGQQVFMSGIIAVDPGNGRVLSRYDELPAAARERVRALGYDTGQLSVDVYEAPIVVQSWAVLARIEQLAAEAGGSLADVVRLVQYFRDLRHYPAYNRIRGAFFDQPVVSTVVEVSRMLPSDDVWIEVEATLVLPA